MRAGSDRVRLAELIAALSLGIDLGFGQPMEHVLRQCLIALRIAQRAGISEQDHATVYYTALLINVGCHTDAYEQARWFGDDIALKSGKYGHELRGVSSTLAGIRRLGAGHPLVRRFRIGVEFAMGGHRELDQMIEHHSAIARQLAEQLALPEAVCAAVGAAYEQWDGKGWPGQARGTAVPAAARVAQIAEFLEVAYRVGGVQAAQALARRQHGKQFDPGLCDLIIDQGELILSGLEQARTWSAVIDAEPGLAVTLSEDEFDAALEAVADFIDLKSPYFLGHSRALAALAAGAGAELGMSAGDISTLRRAALVSGFGRLGVSNAIWDKAGELGAGEWERVRLHPYLTERMLHDSPALSPLGAIAAQLRERLDGSGYPRGLPAAAIPRSARVLAAADAYQAMLEPRAHRPALSPEEATARLCAEVTAGRLDSDAVRAVLNAAGHRIPVRSEAPAGLTAREIEVLRHAARGMTNKDIAAVLFISPKTVANHIEHIYLKIGASNRAMASLFATRNGLLAEEETVYPPR